MGLTQKEWDAKAREIFESMADKDPTKPEIRRVVLRRLGPRPETPEIEDMVGTIQILKKLSSRRGWHKLQCAKETKDRIWAMEFAQVFVRPSGWYEMKLTKKGRKFLRDVEKKKEVSDGASRGN